MTLSDLASIGSLVSGIAVLISLIYLSVQVKQAERNQQASIRQARVDGLMNLVLVSVEPSLAVATARARNGDDDISDTEYLQYQSYSFATFVGGENNFYQHQQGMLDHSAFRSFVGNLRVSFSAPGFRVMWRAARGRFQSDFVEFMDKIMAEVPVSVPADALAKFKADVAAEKVAA